MEEPAWVPRIVVDHAHFSQVVEHGGSQGVRHENALESALARPVNRYHYARQTGFAELAAAYAYAIARSHPFADANKRTAFVTAAVFLELNGFEIVCDEREVIDTMLAAASGPLPEPALAGWFGSVMRPFSR